MKAVIDRFEGDLAVLILADEDQLLTIPRKLLPRKAREGSWLTLDRVEGKTKNIKLDKIETDLARERIAAKLARLPNGEKNE
jgi:hypothetical protein